jgi:hypothetical protein
MYPDRCAGWTKLLPVFTDAFAQGHAGVQPVIQAARLEAALLWFIYLSAMHEDYQCLNVPLDCDDVGAYYTESKARDNPVGLAAYFYRLSPATHDRVYDGLLAVRCWRNVDNEKGTASNLDLYQRAFDQVDRAMLRGFAIVIRKRFTELDCTVGDEREARLAFIQTLAPWFDRAARAIDPAKADVLAKQAAAATPDQVDVGAAVAALDALFPCP